MNVYFTDFSANPECNLIKKLQLLVNKAGLEELDCQGKFVAIKIHFGELGNLAYLRHNYVAKMVSMLRDKGAKPYLTDSNTLYTGSRSNAVDHLQTAFLNGFNPISVPGAPVIIADGLLGKDEAFLEIPNGEYGKKAKIGSAIAQADIVVSMTHFKGHEQTGFGGTLKNLGMGAASVAGKMFLHSDSKPIVDRELCIGCGWCVKNCRHKAIALDDQQKAVINYDKCVGCGQCIATCQQGAAQANMDTSTRDLAGKIAEYAYAVVHGKPQLHVSFITDVSPNCDCWATNDKPIVSNIGMLASTDPVALDQACYDLVKAAAALPGSRVNPHGDNDLKGCDKFTHALLHPTTDGLFGLAHAEKIGLGTRQYTLVTIQG